MPEERDEGPQNWVVPECPKPDERELMEKLSASLSKNTFYAAKKATKNSQSEFDARANADLAAAEAAAIADEAAAAAQTKKKKAPFCPCGSADAVDPRATAPAPSPAAATALAARRTPPSAPEDPSGTLADPTSGVTYKIEKVIGEGGFSRVLLVRPKDGHLAENDAESGKFYAAKIIPKAHLKLAGDSFIKATMLERNLLAGVVHPFLLRLYHSFQEKDRLVMVVDFCQGGSVHYHVNVAVKATGRGLDEKRAAFYVAEIAMGLSALHKFGIVHRDLKLENVLVKANGHLAICDFGTSKTLRRTPTDGAPPAPASDDAARTRGLEPLTKSIIGTPAYMAPEMLLEQPYSYSVDWWALGVTYFTMLRARLPFDGGRNHEEEKMLWRIVKSRPRYDVTWQSETRECLQLLLQKVPKTRICSLTQLKTQPIYADFAWDAVEAETVAPPFVPRFGCRAVVQTGVPSRDFGDAAAATRIFRGGVVAAPPRLRT
mmetsp:Transcript_17211/g.52271  ORF Transcript_17211/g.52271 Transcript_17211/m.52271 type:complete len:489 (-) Transcript_17211:174-1640(-)